MKSVADLGTILGIWAHPDDESWACAGVMAAAIDNGQRVACITATRGEAGKTASQEEWPKEHLAQIRETELGNALSIIGVHELHWLNYRDGTLNKIDKQEAVARLARLIDKIAPDTILTFEPEGITGHADHKTICAWTCAAVSQSKCQPAVYGACETSERYNKLGRECSQQFNIYYQTDRPFTVAEKDGDLVFRLSKTQAQQKLEAIKAHESQSSPLMKDRLGKKYLQKLCDVECFIEL
jgi:LmbE family N-acetylglucosaminyl deacetylase